MKRYLDKKVRARRRAIPRVVTVDHYMTDEEVSATYPPGTIVLIPLPVYGEKP